MHFKQHSSVIILFRSFIVLLIYAFLQAECKSKELLVSVSISVNSVDSTLVSHVGGVSSYRTAFLSASLSNFLKEPCKGEQFLLDYGVVLINVFL